MSNKDFAYMIFTLIIFLGVLFITNKILYPQNTPSYSTSLSSQYTYSEIQGITNVGGFNRPTNSIIPAWIPDPDSRPTSITCPVICRKNKSPEYTASYSTPILAQYTYGGVQGTEGGVGFGLPTSISTLCATAYTCQGMPPPITKPIYLTTSQTTSYTYSYSSLGHSFPIMQQIYLPNYLPIINFTGTTTLSFSGSGLLSPNGQATFSAYPLFYSAINYSGYSPPALSTSVSNTPAF